MGGQGPRFWELRPTGDRVTMGFYAMGGASAVSDFMMEFQLRSRGRRDTPGIPQAGQVPSVLREHCTVSPDPRQKKEKKTEAELGRDSRRASGKLQRMEQRSSGFTGQPDVQARLTRVGVSAAPWGEFEETADIRGQRAMGGGGRAQGLTLRGVSLSVKGTRRQ